MLGDSTLARAIRVALVVFMFAPASAAIAQQSDAWQGFQFPERRLPENPPLEKEPALQVLPPVDPSLVMPGDGSGLRFELRSVNFVGNTAFDTETLESIAKPYLGRSVSTADLLALRYEITRRYVEAGYISSGARIPDQVPIDGQVTIEIVESRLSEIEVETPDRLRSSLIKRRLELEMNRPLRIDRIERRLRIVQSALRLRRLDARIEPGAQPGQDRIVLSVEERSPHSAWGEAGTLVSPSIGGYAGRVGADLESPLGLGDRVRMRVSVAEGLVDLEGLFEVPITRYDTVAAISGRYGESRVVAAPLRDLDIQTRFISLALEIRQPIWRERNQRVEVGMMGEWRDARAEIGDFSLSLTEGARDGKFRVAALRFFALGVLETPRQIISARSTWSVGIDALGATINPGNIEDGRYFAWLGQLQVLRSLERLPLDILVRANVQLATDRLLPIERYAIGGRDTVRGYRENLFVRDNGANGSIEIRWPILRDLDRRRVIELAAFFDGGVSWETKREDNQSDPLASLGIALRYAPNEWTAIELSYARRILDLPSVLDRDLQDTGAYFRFELRTP